MAIDNKAKFLREAERHVQQGKVALAINEYLKIIKEDPEDVLSLNTLGDLYLHQRKLTEANQIFMRVADNYARNNFLLKAIAVYRKVLDSEPDNLEVIQSLGSLYARQGMNVEARNEYMRLGDMLAHDGRPAESLAAYEKVVEIDPTNAPIQMQLAETYLAQHNTEKAYLLFAGAARAQMKAGEISDAMTSFRRALAVNWTSSDALKGFLETALQAGDFASALFQIQECVQGFPEDPVLQELLGRVYHATGDLDRAEQCLQSALKADESHYTHFLALSKSFLQSGDPERALSCLDAIVSVLICRRETETLVQAYDLILAEHPSHLATLHKLADILSAANDNVRYIGALEKITQIYQTSGKPVEAIKHLEKILEINSDSRFHLDLHRELFALAFPGKPYQLPRALLEARRESIAQHEEISVPAPIADTEAGASSSIVEIDLLLNYGLKEKALQLLHTLEMARPEDKEVRQRLCAMYQEQGQRLQAAQQCVLLSLLHRKSGDLDAAGQSWNEAKSLAPEWVNSGLDAIAFAQEHGIVIEASPQEFSDKTSNAGLEVDLSGDLSEIFFKDMSGESPPVPSQAADLATVSDDNLDKFPTEMPRPTAPESAEEQLQEVDFYIRLGFQDEAHAKLTEIASAFPGHPALASRYTQLGITPPEPVAVAPSAPDVGPPKQASKKSDLPPSAHLEAKAGSAAQAGFSPPLASEPLGNDLEAAAGEFGVNRWFEPSDEQAAPEPAAPGDDAPPLNVGEIVSPAPAPKSATNLPANSMFTDLIAEMDSLTDQEISGEDYETHFNLGIAFREMGLLDDAIREFQISVKVLDPQKSAREAIQCCGMLSTCFLEKGMPRSAIRWCQTGLSIKEISSHETTALRYDMGVAHAKAGESDKALECFGMVFGVDPGYRDVAQQIDHIKIGLERNAP